MKHQLPSLTRFVRKMRGGAQSFLALSSDGNTYVVKVHDNPQGRNVLFNEALGSELYRMLRLPTPQWQALKVTKSFLDSTPGCWIESSTELLKPEAGMCFGSRYLDVPEDKLFQVLPGSSIAQVDNLSDFWTAWVVDICCGHSDHRQALFTNLSKRRFHACFMDHGHLFGGANGSAHPSHRASRHLDDRYYGPLTLTGIKQLHRCIMSLNCEKLMATSQKLPAEWATETARTRFAAALDNLKTTQYVSGIAAQLMDTQPPPRSCSPHDTIRRVTDTRSNWVLPDWLPEGRHEFA